MFSSLAISRRGRARRLVLAAVVAMLAFAMQVSTHAPAIASGKVIWVGGFTAAYAVNPAPVLNASTEVIFQVSNSLNDPSTHGAAVKMFDGGGNQLGMCTAGTTCGVVSNPLPGSSKSYYAELWAPRVGGWEKIATSSTITVSDPGWTGSFTSVYAVNASPVLSESTSVVFEVDSTLSSAEIRMFDGAGTFLGACNWGTSCGVSSNPAPGGWKSYYAELWASRGGGWVKIATSGTVTVTDPGWTGSFTGAYAVDPTPAFSESTTVAFEVGSTLSYAEIRIFAGSGTFLGACNWGTSCCVTSNPVPGTWKTYYAELWASRNGGLVKIATSGSVVVTDPGWTGAFTSAVALPANGELEGATTARFTWNEPLQHVWVDIVDSSGAVRQTCSATGALECSVTVVGVPGESLTLHAEARHHGPAGSLTTVASSAPVDVAEMDTEAFAALILTASESALAQLLGSSRAAQAAALQSQHRSLTFCHALGLRFPGNAMFRSSVPDATLVCMSSTVTLLAWLISTVGIDAALDGMSDAADADADLGAPSDPGVGGGGFDDPDCYFYNFSGQCIDVGVENPALGSHVQDAPMPTYWGGTTLLCRAIHVDPDTGERTTYELRADGLEHIVRFHVARPDEDKSIWGAPALFDLPSDPEVLEEFEDRTTPQEFAALVDFLCQNLATLKAERWGPSVRHPGNEVRIYRIPGVDVGKTGVPSTSTDEFTFVITPQGDVWSAYPGTSPILE
jgi:hypothetical protein